MPEITVENSIRIQAPREEVFRYLATWQNAPHYTPRLAKLRQVGEVGYGLGTRLRGTMRLGHLQMESESEVVIFEDNTRIVCRIVGGVESSNTWLLAGNEQATDVTAIVTYRTGGTLVGRLAGRLVAREIADTVALTLLNLKRMLESKT